MNRSEHCGLQGALLTPISSTHSDDIITVYPPQVSMSTVCGVYVHDDDDAARSSSVTSSSSWSSSSSRCCLMLMSRSPAAATWQLHTHVCSILVRTLHTHTHTRLSDQLSVETLLGKVVCQLSLTHRNLNKWINTHPWTLFLFIIIWLWSFIGSTFW